jgi:hypothetical protein
MNHLIKSRSSKLLTDELEYKQIFYVWRIRIEPIFGENNSLFNDSIGQ